MYRAHNFNPLQLTPGPANLRVIDQVLKSRQGHQLNVLCVATSTRTNQQWKKHVEILHNNKFKIGETIKKKRPLASFNCQKCNSTFDKRYSMKKHIEKRHGVKKFCHERNGEKWHVQSPSENT